MKHKELTTVHKHFQQQDIFFRCKKIDRQQKKEEAIIA